MALAGYPDGDIEAVLIGWRWQAPYHAKPAANVELASLVVPSAGRGLLP